MLEIDRLSLNIRAATAATLAERFARRLRDATVAGIERARYAPALPGAPAYVFIDRIELQCAVNGEWDDDTIGATVAQRLASVLERGLDLPGSIAFRDRPELLAAFYSALAEGCAWERWWFETFDGLKALPASSALRTSVINEGADGVAGLARLTSTALRQVLALLVAADVRRLLAWFATRTVSNSVPLLSIWRASASLPADAPADARWIAAMIAAERAGAGSAGAATLRTLRAMAALRAAAAAGSWRAPGAGQFARERLRVLLAALSHDCGWLDDVADDDAEVICAELSACAAASGGPTQDAQDSTTGGFTTHGGIFVLLKVLTWLDWPASWRRCIVGTDADELARALAFVVAARALEGRRAAGVLRDAALRTAFAVDDPLALLRRRRRDAARALGSIELGMRPGLAAQRLLHGFAERVPGLAGASHGYLRRNALALPASIERHVDRVVVRLGRAPLDVLLVLAGARGGSIALPGGVALALAEESAA